MLDEAELLNQTRQALADWPAPSYLSAIIKGGSDRHFFRIHFQDPSTPCVILMAYTLVRPDNPRFVSATTRLSKLGVHVPKVFAHDSTNLLVWLEDLGSVDLHALRHEPWSTRGPLYESALTEAAKLHAVDVSALPQSDLNEMELCFDETLYEWEQNYFLSHYVRDLKNHDLNDARYKEARRALLELRTHLAALPRGLVHRDFQSQNILVRDGTTWLIDYQGARPGLAEYDIASLLLDPYVDLSEAERESLLRWYANHMSKKISVLQENYLLCAAQRLMQAIGAYANLSRNLGKPNFAQHIPVALGRLRNVCQSHPMLKPLLVFTDSD
ncbi:MAG: phosphotransferase [Verrucomicrobia bacterium]|nr:phosphotransferase [Verrucomicrobiota bacterium]